MQKKTTKRPTKGKEPKNNARCAYFPFFPRKQADLLEKTASKRAFITTMWLRYFICHLEFEFFKTLRL